MKDRSDFWKDLMGDDFDENAYDDQQEKIDPPLEKGFTIEYVNSEGESLQKPKESNEPPHPVAEPFRKAGRQKPLTGMEGLSEETVGSKDFEVDFDFDKEYDDVQEKPVRRGRTKRTGCLGGIMFFIFIIAISVILACLGWKAAVDVLGLGAENQIVEITIPKSIISDKEVEEEDEDGNKVKKTVTSADIDVVADALYDNGLIQYKWLFKLYSKFSKADETIKAGTYQLNMDYDYRALVNGMNPAGGIRVETKVTVPEGYTILQIAKLLEENKVCDKNEFLDAAANYDFEDYEFIDRSTRGDVRRLEGFLFPDTYNVYVGDTAARVLNKMLSNFESKWTEEFQTQADALGYSMRDVIIIASMIEKEAGGDSERATIASVIYNRLENPGASTAGYLNIDATIYYAIEGTGEDFSTELDDPYNTYKYTGMTPGPIANPGTASIRAALWPEDTDYFYYGLGTDGLHRFFENYDPFIDFLNSEEYGG